MRLRKTYFDSDQFIFVVAARIVAIVLSGDFGWDFTATALYSISYLDSCNADTKFALPLDTSIEASTIVNDGSIKIEAGTAVDRVTHSLSCQSRWFHSNHGDLG